MSDFPLVILSSPYRSLSEPLIEYVLQLRQQDPESYIHLVMGGLTIESYWEPALHRKSTLAMAWPLAIWKAWLSLISPSSIIMNMARILRRAMKVIAYINQWSPTLTKE